MKQLVPISENISNPKSIFAGSFIKPSYIVITVLAMLAYLHPVKSYAGNNPVIVLKGDTGLLDTMKLEQGYAYNEPGDSAWSPVYGNITKNIVVTTKLVGGTSTFNNLLTGTYIFSYNVTDAAGNKATTRYRVVRVTPDKTPPDLKLSKNAKTGTDTILQAVSSSPVNIRPSLSSYVISSIDLVDGNLTASVHIDSSSVQTTVVGIYPVAYSATDISGNRIIKYMYVDVIDTAPPVITLKGPINDSIPVFTLFKDPGFTYSDNYTALKDIKFTVTGTFYDAFPAGKPANKVGGGRYAGQKDVAPVYTIIYTATDGAGNTTKVSRYVGVYDTIPPVVKLVGPKAVQICIDSSYIDAGFNVTDNYEDSTSMVTNGWIRIIGNYTANGVSKPGLSYLTYTAMDQSHNIGISAKRFIEILPSTDINCKSGKKSNNIIDTTICNGSCAILTAPVSGSAYLWSTGETTKSIQFCPASDTNTAVYVTITLSSGTVSYLYSITVTSNTCVWPGDANSDGIADKDDVLAIGVAYNDSGAKRPNATTSWTGQPCSDWTNSFKSGANHKNADCNGDGIVDSTDMLAVSKNYGYKHYKAGSQNGSPSDPPLSVSFAKDSTLSGDTVTATINLGTASNPVTNAYGLAFSLSYNFLYVKAGKAKLNINHCWLGTEGKNLISFMHDDSAKATIDFAITRTDHKNISGYGELAKVSIVMQDNLGGKTYVNRKVLLTPSDVKMISFDQSQIPLYATGDSIVVTGPLAAISNNVSKALKDIRMYPNPASQIIHIDPGNQNITNIRIINTLGMAVYNQNEPNKGVLQIPVSQLNSGIYTVIIDTKNGTVTRQICKN